MTRPTKDGGVSGHIVVLPINILSSLEVIAPRAGLGLEDIVFSVLTRQIITLSESSERLLGAIASLRTVDMLSDASEFSKCLNGIAFFPREVDMLGLTES